MLRDILSGKDAQVEAVVAVLTHIDADVLVLSGVDFDLYGETLGALADRLSGYNYRFARRPNRGWPSGRDLDGDGRIGGPGDAYGWGDFSGQGGLAIISRLVIPDEQVRDLSGLAWSTLSGHFAPVGYGDRRLSTTAHWVVPVQQADGTLFDLMVWHATPPVFDGPLDENGRRNHDEAALWSAYLDGQLGPRPDRPFVIAGFANLDPLDGDVRSGALDRLLADRRLTDPKPRSQGGVNAATNDGGINLTQRGDAALDTADWGEDRNGPGNLRVTYVLPSAEINVLDAGVFWPMPDQLFGGDVVQASRHRVVWADICLQGCGQRGQDGGVAKVGQKGLKP